MTLGDLRVHTAHLPDSTPIGYADPNFGGLYHEPITLSCFNLPHPPNWPGMPEQATHILINFPFETPVD